jgi:hypothetical protein
MTPNKVTEAINHFTSRGVQPTPGYKPSRAESLGLKPPAPSAEQLDGLLVEARLSANRNAAIAAGQEKYQQEKREFEAARDAAVWARIQARNMTL